MSTDNEEVTLTLTVEDWRFIHELLANEYGSTGDTAAPPLMEVIRREVRETLALTQDFWYLPGEK